MKTLSLTGTSGPSRIVIGGTARDLPSLAGVSKWIAITDSNVRRLHGDLLGSGPVLEVGLGEENKTLATVERLYEGLLDAGADRSTLVVGFGGGIVCDLAGFAASTFLRGTRLAFVPTTLLAQVDASVGGKNGVNFRQYKNQVGVFRQPELVICDPSLLKTLPAREIRCGLAEVVKAGAIADEALFAYLESHVDDVLALHPDAVERIVASALEVKAALVQADERESGVRMKLNFGHTFGHAIEKTLKLPHGEAVSLGMVIASELAVARGLLPREHAGRIEKLLERLGLPTRAKLDQAAIADALGKDKKRAGGTVNAVLLEAIGAARIEPLSIEEISGALR